MFRWRRLDGWMLRFNNGLDRVHRNMLRALLFYSLLISIPTKQIYIFIYLYFHYTAYVTPNHPLYQSSSTSLNYHIFSNHKGSFPHTTTSITIDKLRTMYQNQKTTITSWKIFHETAKQSALNQKHSCKREIATLPPTLYADTARLSNFPSPFAQHTTDFIDRNVSSTLRSNYRSFVNALNVYIAATHY